MKKVLVPLADGCEELEVVAITDILTRAGATVVTAGLQAGPIKASRGMTLVPDTTLAQVQDDLFDLIALPGGLPGAIHLAEDSILHVMMQNQDLHNRTLAAICAAPQALAIAGLLTNRTLTCYPGALDGFDCQWTNTGAALEIDRNLITGRGPGVALEFALELVNQLYGPERRAQVADELAG
ncbi:DJ-1 family glyoxalase III [Reinekea sp.]|uniref:DJ-1 family glyoxalase III n=1 Tax=Reinekea sp. TaxID=1970455 RepID=UPI002A7F8A98|nr:DJ-1 family glyoxalase III [Reinekea sp.]